MQQLTENSNFIHSRKYKGTYPLKNPYCFLQVTYLETQFYVFFIILNKHKIIINNNLLFMQMLRSRY